MYRLPLTHIASKNEQEKSVSLSFRKCQQSTDYCRDSKRANLFPHMKAQAGAQIHAAMSCEGTDQGKRCDIRERQL